MTTLTLSAASIIVDKALAEARARGFQPLTVAVLDAGGHLVALKREDRSSLLRPQIATGKAWGALGMGFGGREFARRAATALCRDRRPWIAQGLARRGRNGRSVGHRACAAARHSGLGWGQAKIQNPGARPRGVL